MIGNNRRMALLVNSIVLLSATQIISCPICFTPRAQQTEELTKLAALKSPEHTHAITTHSISPVYAIPHSHPYPVTQPHTESYSSSLPEQQMAKNNDATIQK